MQKEVKIGIEKELETIYKFQELLKSYDNDYIKQILLHFMAKVMT